MEHFVPVCVRIYVFLCVVRFLVLLSSAAPPHVCLSRVQTSRSLCSPVTRWRCCLGFQRRFHLFTPVSVCPSLSSPLSVCVTLPEVPDLAGGGGLDLPHFAGASHGAGQLGHGLRHRVLPRRYRVTGDEKNLLKKKAF